MSFVLRPWQLLFLILSGWVNREQQEIIEVQNAQIPSPHGEDGQEADPGQRGLENPSPKSRKTSSWCVVGLISRNQAPARATFFAVASGFPGGG